MADVGRSMSPPGQEGSLPERLKALEDVQKAAFNILEDFNEERVKLERFQQATMNLLDDMYLEQSKLGETEHALMNMLEDIEVEREKVEMSRALLESANKEMEAFSYSVSHDLQAPLRALSGFSKALLEDYSGRLDEEGRKYLNFIRDNAHKMGQLISDLLAFSRLSRQQMLESDIDMLKLAGAVFEEQRAAAAGRQIERIFKEMPPARGDAAMIRQVLVNLISNAVKFTGSRERAVIEMGCQQRGNECAYFVRDNGAGFDMRYAHKLFGVFQRLHREDEFPGTGVGLALVQRIIVRHGGRVWAEGAVGEGATFYFTLSKGGPVK